MKVPQDKFGNLQLLTNGWGRTLYGRHSRAYRLGDRATWDQAAFLGEIC